MSPHQKVLSKPTLAGPSAPQGRRLLLPTSHSWFYQPQRTKPKADVITFLLIKLTCRHSCYILATLPHTVTKRRLRFRETMCPGSHSKLSQERCIKLAARP